MAHEGFRNLSYTNKRSVAKKQVICVQAKYLTILISCITLKKKSFKCIIDIMANGGMLVNIDWQESGNCHDVYSNIYPTRCNFIQFIYIRKLVYMFRVLLPPIIRSAYNCIYSIWYLPHRYCYLPLLWRSWNCSSNSSTTAARSSNGVANTRCCRYNCMRS